MSDAELIAHLRAVIATIGARHAEDEHNPGWCQECGPSYPCDTIRIITAADGAA